MLFRSARTTNERNSQSGYMRERASERERERERVDQHTSAVALSLGSLHERAAGLGRWLVGDGNGGVVGLVAAAVGRGRSSRVGDVTVQREAAAQCTLGVRSRQRRAHAAITARERVLARTSLTSRFAPFP